MKYNFPTPVSILLSARGGRIDADLRGTADALAALCAANGYPQHDAVARFEQEFGGLLLADEGDVVHENEPHWLFGAHACLRSQAHVSPRGGTQSRALVPVAYSPNDVIYFLDANGRAYGQDTIAENKASYFAENGLALVCRILLEDELFARTSTTVELKGLQGAALRDRLGLVSIDAASDGDRRYYGDPQATILVVEEVKAKRTIVACATAAQAATIAPPMASVSASSPAASAAELAAYAGKEQVSMAGEKRTSLPDIFDHLPALKELDASRNQLTELPASLWRVKGLTALDISFNPIEVLPDGIGEVKTLKKLVLRGCSLRTLPAALAGAKHLTNLRLSECEALDVDAALQVIAQLPKLTDLSLPLSRSLTSLAPLAGLPIKSLQLNGSYVQHPTHLPAGLGLLPKLTDLEIQYADAVAGLPEAQADVDALRHLFGKKFTAEDIQKSAQRQPEKLYLQAYAARL